jgi:hypothetical protein
VLAQHCAREGTEHDRIRKTILWAAPLRADAASRKDFAEHMAGDRAGVDELHFMPWTPDLVAFKKHWASTLSRDSSSFEHSPSAGPWSCRRSRPTSGRTAVDAPTMARSPDGTRPSAPFLRADHPICRDAGKR